MSCAAASEIQLYVGMCCVIKGMAVFFAATFQLHHEQPAALFLVTNLKQKEAQSAPAESAHKGANQRSKDVTQVQQRPESPINTVRRSYSACGAISQDLTAHR